MSALSAELQSITIQDNGQYNINFADGNGFAFGSLEELAGFIDGLEVSFTPQLLGQMLLRWWHLRDPDLTNVGIVLGKQLSFDMSAPLMLEVS